MPSRREELELGPLSDFPEGSHRVVQAGGRRVGVFNIRGNLYALPNLCPHQTGPLCESARLTGTLVATRETDWKPAWVFDGEIVTCPWHGLEYHVPTGRCLALPEISIRTYEVKVEDGVVRLVL
jgi:nitrite reductase (NADH) small subunit